MRPGFLWLGLLGFLVLGLFLWPGLLGFPCWGFPASYGQDFLLPRAGASLLPLVNDSLRRASWLPLAKAARLLRAGASGLSLVGSSWLSLTEFSWLPPAGTSRLP